MARPFVPPKGPAKIIVGYRTRVRAPEVLAALTPKFEAARNLKDPEKIAADIAARRARFEAEAKDMAYAGEFDSVVLLDLRYRRIERWDRAGREPGVGKKLPIVVAMANWLLEKYPDAWSPDKTGPPEVIFIGFNPRCFLKMFGLCASLPEVARPLPLRMWSGTSDHRDVERVAIPEEYKDITLAMVLACRRPLEAKARDKWDEAVKDWPGPGVDPEADVVIATELAAQLGMLKE